jgi:hypothetical protein
MLDDLDLIAVGDDAAAGADANVGVAAEVLATLDGFEEEAFGGLILLSSAHALWGGEAEEGGDGGFEVGGEGAVERDEGVGAAEAQELGALGLRRPHGGQGTGLESEGTGYRLPLC